MRTTVIFDQVFYFASVISIFCHMSLGAKSASLTDVSVQSDDLACYNFTVGNPHKKEFYSPNYPNPYPSNTKCTKIITADVGHIVEVDFRDIFHLEFSTSAPCEYDRLEVRDGAYGYSTLLGVFCGSGYPKKLLSSKRSMRLQFKSDNSIEHKGFRAVYKYLPVQNTNAADSDAECAFSKTGHSGIINKTEMDLFWKQYPSKDSYECMWTIETQAGMKLYINFIKFKLDKPNDCQQNFLQLFGDGRTTDKELAKFCGTTAEPQKSHGNVTQVRLYTHKSAFNGTEFSLHYTSFRETKKDEKCDSKTEFNCGDQTCIDISLRCDNQFDCKYRYDEEPSICLKALGASMVLTSEHMIIILVVFFSLVIAMCASISISCYNKIKERQLREREYKERRSKEASVEATLDRSTASQPRAAAAAAALRTDDDSSDGGCYVPEVDLSVFGQKQRSNGGDTIPKKLRNTPLQQQPQQYPYISESFESLQSDVLVPPAPPPVPRHMQEQRSPPPAPNYRIVGGKVVASDPPPWERPAAGYKREEADPKANWMRGPLEAGAPARPSAFGRPGGLSSRVTPDSGPRGPLAAKGGYRPPASSARNYGPTPELPSDSSRAHSVASTLSAPDALSAMQKR